MEQKFNATLSLIQDKKRKIAFYEKELKDFFERELKDDFNNFSTILNGYYDNYGKYLELLGKYEHVEKISPLDVFPGIRTVKSVADISSMAQDSTEMEKIAGDIKQSEASLEKREGDLIKNIKHINTSLSTLLALHGEVQEAYRQIMEQMGSVYDVGFLSRNS
jgi:hypothetical protein